MSDGGAKVIVVAGQGVLQLARFGVGRVVLWFIAAWLALSALTARDDVSVLGFLLAGLIALAALIGGFLAERRKRAERASLKAALMLVGLVLVSLAGAFWLMFRKKSGDEPPTAPSEAEIDELLR